MEKLVCVGCLFDGLNAASQILRIDGSNQTLEVYERGSDLYPLLEKGGRWHINQTDVYPTRTTMFRGHALCAVHLVREYHTNAYTLPTQQHWSQKHWRG